MNQQQTHTLKNLWEKAVKLYKEGNTVSSSYFTNEEQADLNNIGMNPQELFDFAEDWVQSSDPDFPTMLLIQEVRYNYLTHVLQGNSSEKTIKVSDLPAKTDEIDGIRWLPRILPKAQAKLRGEMPPELMYCCGGDRRFFRENNINPAEFLRMAAIYADNEAEIISWVKRRRESHKSFLASLKDLF